jgi:hypothetical protein
MSFRPAAAGSANANRFDQYSVSKIRNRIRRHAVEWEKLPGTAITVARRRAVLPTRLLRGVDAWAKLRNLSQSSSLCQAILPTLHAIPVDRNPL